MYHVIYTDPDSKETVRAVPLCPSRLRRQYVMELLHLIDYGPGEQWRVLSFTSTIWTQG